MTFDPCPQCQGAVTGVSAEPEYIVDNPGAVLRIGPPDCDGGEDCQCSVITNPAPDPLLDTRHVVNVWVTMRPCGHQLHRHELRSWYVHQEVPSEQG